VRPGRHHPPWPSALACLTLFAACGSVPPPRVAAAPVQPVAVAARSGPKWLSEVPVGCALGDSGPTLAPTAALTEARRRARARLVARTAAISTKSVEVTTGRGQRADEHQQVILEEAEGWVRNSVIVALWYDDAGNGPEGQAGCAYAVACPRFDPRAPASTALRSLMAARRGPEWLYALPAGEGRLCAVGVSGPTLQPADALINAKAAATAELAEAIAVHARTSTGIFDDDIVYGAVTQACDDCGSRAAGAQVVGSWVDERGEGPLPFAGTSYIFSCISP
jgi:hypothetical protein